MALQHLLVISKNGTFLHILINRQCTYNVTLRYFHEKNVSLGKAVSLTYFCVCVCVGGCTSGGVCLRVCSLTNPECNEPPYCHLGPLRLNQIFWHYLIKGTALRKSLLKIKCVFSFSTQLLFEIFLIPRRFQTHTVLNVKTSSCKVPYILVGF